MAKFALGQAVSRAEDLTLVKGAGRYADDVRLPNEAYAFVLRSPHAHAALRRLDASAARRAPGVLAVLAGVDARADGLGDIPCMIPVTNVDGSPRGETPRPLLAIDRVRHVGDPVALVVADSLQRAKDAAELIEADYEPLPAVADTYAAAKPGAPRVWADVGNNVCFDIAFGDRAAVDAAFARAKHVTRAELVNNRLVANPLEPRAAVADYDPATDRSTLYTPTQGPHLIHGQLAGQILKLDPRKLRVVSGNVGGGFGMKIFLHPEQPLVVWASRKLKRPVRWTGERSETFLSDVQGRDNYSVAELALDGDAKFLALRVTTYANMGAYLSNFGPFIPQLAFVVLSSVYRIPAIALDVKGVVTNTVPVDAYRGAGRPEGIYLVERIVDVAARELGLGADDIRRRNFIDTFPYRTPVESEYDSGDFAGTMALAMEQAGWAGFPARRAAAAKRGRLRGLGLGMYIERCGAGSPDTVTLRVGGDGKVTLISGMQDNGQGHVTGFKQVLSAALGIDADAIEVVQGDTDVVPDGLTGGSRFLAIGGVAATAAADEAVAKGRETAAGLLEAAAADIEYRDGRYWIAGTDRGVSLFEVAAKARGLEATHTRNPEKYTYPNGCHIVEVEIDPETGETRIERYTIVDDFGRAINPLLLEGQVHGGTVQGVGQALLEHGYYDPETAQLLAGSFMDYALPRADDVPSFDCGFNHTLCTTNPLGVKGAGESGAVGAPAAVVSAVVDALYANTGLRHLDMPTTREKVWRALRESSRAV
ncbi:MAG TPA: xanthine dehydrogenase family protein molybdopterin-binding subunit [Burkholderiales bacterium]|nr:xanthine dehydrogenase family protein molybdopterin-binding subunit [Burkholderiales bacterium]